MRTEADVRTGAELLVDELKIAGIDTIFCITGAGNLAIVDAIKRDNSIKMIYSHHEQASVMAAQGFARTTGKIGVALVTTGGGTSNALTGVLSAYLDSIPLLVISGNESSFHCANPWNLRAYGVQGFDSISTFKNVTKNAMRISETKDISSNVRNSIQMALSDRMGPCHIDFPMDLQRKKIDPQDVPMRSVYLDESDTEDFKFSQELSQALSEDPKVVLYLGNGIRYSKNLNDLRKMIQEYRLPFVLSWSAIDLMPGLEEFNIGRVGIYGDRAANLLIQKCSIVIAIGTRLAIPQIGYDKLDFARNAKKFIVEIDSTECSKFDDLGWNVLKSSATKFIGTFGRILEAIQSDLETEEWLSECNSVISKFPRINQIGNLPQTGEVHSAHVIEFLNDNLTSDSIVVTDVGAGLLTGHYLLNPNGKQRVFTSQGLGEMGFGLPGAIGAYFGSPNSQIICLNTDGAIMFNLQELQVVKEHKIPLKLFIFNNSGYSMIRISQDNLFDSRLAGSTVNTGISFPNFSELANVFDFDFLRVNSLEKSKSDLLGKLASRNPTLVEIVMSPEQKYLPRLATNKLDNGSFVSPPIEDLDPKISLEELESALGYKAHPNSYLARGLTYETD